MGTLTSKGFSNICAGIMFLACSAAVVAGAIDGNRQTSHNIRNKGKSRAKANA